MQGYETFTGTVLKKKKSLFGKHTLTVADAAHKVTVICGKGIYDQISVGSEVTIGHTGDRLVNFRPGRHTDDQ